MLTVGQLAQHLSTLDPKLPIGIIDIDRHPARNAPPSPCASSPTWMSSTKPEPANRRRCG
jgi:hypothetical protein